MGATVLVAAVATGAALFVALPLLRRPGEAPQARRSDHLGLLERRDRALAALKELEFDHRTGKLSDDDYRALVGPLRREAIELLGAIDRTGSH